MEEVGCVPKPHAARPSSFSPCHAALFLRRSRSSSEPRPYRPRCVASFVERVAPRASSSLPLSLSRRGLLPLLPFSPLSARDPPYRRLSFPVRTRMAMIATRSARTSESMWNASATRLVDAVRFPTTISTTKKRSVRPRTSDRRPVRERKTTDTRERAISTESQTDRARAMSRV